MAAPAAPGELRKDLRAVLARQPAWARSSASLSPPAVPSAAGLCAGRSRCPFKFTVSALCRTDSYLDFKTVRESAIQKGRGEPNGESWTPGCGKGDRGLHLSSRSSVFLIMDPVDSDYRKKYREHVRKKYQASEDGNSCPGVCVPFSERYTSLTMASDLGGADQFLQRRWRHRGTVPEQVPATSLDALFSTGSGTAETVVLLGVAGVGKTTMARKVLLDWATGRLFPERFDAVFCISCRQLDLEKGQASLADLILKHHPELTPKAALKELLVNPQKLLFIVDGLDELNGSLEQQEGSLSLDPCEVKPVSVLLSGLITKRIFPEACLLITTRLSALGSLEIRLQSPRYVGLLGFTAEGREEYFHQFFGDQELAAQALKYVLGNEALFALSFVPGVCRIICTVTKQQLQRSRGDHRRPDKVTAVYALYLSHLCASPCESSERQSLRGLCSLAADGIRRKRVWFKAEELQKRGLAPLDSLPSAWWDHLFRKDPDSDDIYSFIHLSVQEFLTALFYVFEDGANHSETTEQEMKLLLESCSKDRGDLSLTVLFMFGLLNTKIMKCIQEQFGWNMLSTIQGDLLEWLKGHTKINSIYQNYDQLECFHFLYEIHKEEFVQPALSHWTELKMDCLKLTPLDQVALSFCVKRCLNLKTLSLYTCSFLSRGSKGRELPAQPSLQFQMHSEMHPLCQVLKDPQSKIKILELNGCKLNDGCCAELATVLSRNQMLAELNLQAARLTDSGLKFLCAGLLHPNCKVEKLRLWGCDRDRRLTHACCSDLSAVVSRSQTLTELALDYNYFLGDQGVQLLCKGLKHPSCQLQSLGLEQCRLTADSCRDLAPILYTSKMRKLNLERNNLGDAGVKLLCDGLRHPGCSLQTLLVNSALMELTLDYNVLEDSGVLLLCEGLKQPNCQLQILGLYDCDFNFTCCEDLASVLSGNGMMSELLLGSNHLGELGMTLLCEGLKHPQCKLRKLCSEITAAACAELSLVLGTSQTLEDIDLWNNNLEDIGVRLLCSGLKQPTCRLKKIGLHGDQLMEETVRELDSLKKIKPDLIIDR
ncbi:hypothetical protein lerEdw1_012974 [Lerista edwardsae]|nr:hypothetical protein lerEdw1_012974 [Lerista edwardsae]